MLACWGLLLNRGISSQALRLLVFWVLSMFDLQLLALMGWCFYVFGAWRFVKVGFRFLLKDLYGTQQGFLGVSRVLHVRL